MSRVTSKPLFSYEVVEQELARCRAELLTKLRDEVMNLQEWTGNDAENRLVVLNEPISGFYYDREDVLALLEKAGE